MGKLRTMAAVLLLFATAGLVRAQSTVMKIFRAPARMSVDGAANRRHGDHDRLSPPSRNGAEGVGRLGSLRPPWRAGAEVERHDFVQRSCNDRRTAAYGRHLRLAHGSVGK